MITLTCEKPWTTLPTVIISHHLQVFNQLWNWILLQTFVGHIHLTWLYIVLRTITSVGPQLFPSSPSCALQSLFTLQKPPCMLLRNVASTQFLCSHTGTAGVTFSLKIIQFPSNSNSAWPVNNCVGACKAKESMSDDDEYKVLSRRVQGASNVSRCGRRHRLAPRPRCSCAHPRSYVPLLLLLFRRPRLGSRAGTDGGSDIYRGDSASLTKLPGQKIWNMLILNHISQIWRWLGKLIVLIQKKILYSLSQRSISESRTTFTRISFHFHFDPFKLAPPSSCGPVLPTCQWCSRTPRSWSARPGPCPRRRESCPRFSIDIVFNHRITATHIALVIHLFTT